MKHIPTYPEKQLIRDCARRMAGKRHVLLEPIYRCNERGDVALTIAELVPGKWTRFLGRWNRFAQGFKLTADGHGIVEFYVSGLGRNGELEGNVTAYWHDGELTKITGTGCGTMYQRRKPQMKIMLERAEGSVHDNCNRPVKVRSWDEANVILRAWSHTAPRDGTYHKCDLWVKFDDDERTFKGRYDLVHWTCAPTRAEATPLWTQDPMGNPIQKGDVL